MCFFTGYGVLFYIFAPKKRTVHTKKTYLLLLALSLCMRAGTCARQKETKEFYPLIPANGEKQWDVRNNVIFRVFAVAKVE